MNRRGFLVGILALGAAPAIVRATSLMPGRAIIAPSYMASAGSGLLTIDAITREALIILHKNLVFASEINQQFGNFDSGGEMRIVRPKVKRFHNEISWQ